MESLLKSGDLARIRERLELVEAGDPGRWGVMTASEMMCHLRGAFRVALGEIEAAPVALPVPRAVMKAMALWAPMPWPKNVQTVPVLKVGTGAMEAGLFEQDRDETLAAMAEFVRPERARVDHAMFGRMSYEDWMRWGYLHTDHHLRQFGR